MVTLGQIEKDIGDLLVSKQRQTGFEHYWAIDHAGNIYQKSGAATYVTADPALEAAYDNPVSQVRYHHSHPDDRALSLSDLEVLGRAGVREMWAHCVGGSIYGASVQRSATKADFSN
ncbi:hypothetical protein [Methylobacterium sp. sgz302541]|uniref:hypothetical protein n=1 Tax=unclassified Methylobacterium TaxID=2615210 RepID=UPI003D350910